MKDVLLKVINEYELAIYSPEKYSHNDIICLYNKAVWAKQLLNEMED